MKARTVPLDDAFWFQEGPGVRKWQFATSGIKLLNVGNILSSGEVDLSKTDRFLGVEEVEARYKHFLVDEGDLVIASSGISFDDDGLLRTRGAFIDRAHLPLCLNTSTIRFKSREGADLRYLRFWLDSHEFRSQITRRVTGSAQQNFGPSHLQDIKITLPDFSEQKRIAGLLEQADWLRRTRRYALELSYTFLPATFLELFGDPRENPRNWPNQYLSDVCLKFSDGPFGSNLKSEHYRPSGVRVIRLNNIGIGEFLNDNQAFISAEHFVTLRKHECLPGDVLIGTLGDPNLRACVQPPGIKVALNKADCVQARTNPKKANAEYLCGLLNMPSTLYLVPGMVHGQTRARVSMGELAELPIPVPPLQVQEKFAALVARHELLRANQREALRQAEHLFQSLLHRAFSLR